MSTLDRPRSLAAAVFALVVLTAAVWLVTDSSSRRAGLRSGDQAVQAAQESVAAILSYRPETAERDLEAAAGARLTGRFLDDYTQLIRTVVVPTATQRSVTAAARVPAAAVVSADGEHAVVLAYVDQTMTEGTQAPTQTNSTVRVTMELVDGRWLISGFEPI